MTAERAVSTPQPHVARPVVMQRLLNTFAHRVKPFLRHSVRIKSALYRILWLLPERFRSSDPVRSVLLDLSRRNKAPFFVNIGANDGLAGDPLREFIVRFGWNGLLVEPVPFVYERLRKAYSGIPGTICVHAAVAAATGEREFWHVRENAVLAPGYDQVGSFSREQVLKHDAGLFPGISGFLTSTVVPCLSLEELLLRHGSPLVDVYLIDTEGADAMVVQQIDLATHPPLVIIYEHTHLTPDEVAACAARLGPVYHLVTSGGNTLAVRR